MTTLTAASVWMTEQNITVSESTHPSDISSYVDELISEIEGDEDE